VLKLLQRLQKCERNCWPNFWITALSLCHGVERTFMSPVSERLKTFIPAIAFLLHIEIHQTCATRPWRAYQYSQSVFWTVIDCSIAIVESDSSGGYIIVRRSVLVQSYYAGFGNMDYTLERHFKYREYRFCKRHRGFAIEWTIIVFNAVLIPIIGIILVLPISVTAAKQRSSSCISKITDWSCDERGGIKVTL
jgi:CysZ protein